MLIADLAARLKGRIRIQPSRRDNTIVLQLRDRSDLLNPDPSPLSGEVITPEAETYIVRNAKQLRAKEPIRLAIELPAPAAAGTDKGDLGKAITEHFRNAANIEAVDIRELLRSGCKALLMGLLVLSTCLFLAWFYADRLPESRIPRVLQESFVILGWVSMWRLSRYSCTNGCGSSGEEISFCALARRP